MTKILSLCWRSRINQKGIILIPLFLCTIASCMSLHPVPFTETAARYNPIVLASGVPEKPGSLAWSPDGKQLAFTGKTLTIIEPDSGRKESFPIDAPYYVAWASDGNLYALSLDRGGKTLLSTIEAGNHRLTQKVLDGRTDAVYPTSDGKKLIFFALHSKSYSFGTEVSADAMQQDLSTGSSKTIYTYSRTCMVKQPEAESWTSMMHAGLNPLDDTLLVMEYIKPPLLPMYTRVKAINLTTAESSDISDPETRKEYVSATWSPDGKRAALTDGESRVEIRNVAGRASVLDWSPLGMFPSWNPRGSSIYAGGYLIDSNGKNKEALLEHAQASIGAWSPDGTVLAVVVDGRLVLFSKMRTSYVDPDGPPDPHLKEKLFVLDRLRADSLISHEEYITRRTELLLKSGKEK